MMIVQREKKSDVSSSCRWLNIFERDKHRDKNFSCTRFKKFKKFKQEESARDGTKLLYHQVLCFG